MNFEELRNKYQQENEGEVTIPSSVSQLKKAIHPLERLQKDMKKEFFMQSAALLLFAFSPFLLDIKRQFFGIYYTVYAMIFVVSVYYLYGFYKFYQLIGLYDGSTLNSLWKIYYELRLNVERYRSFGFLLLPFFWVTLGLHFYSKPAFQEKSLMEVGNSFHYTIVFATMAGTILIVAGIVLWSKYIYGPYIKKLDQLLDELKTEE
jgi:hypothetical protein